MSRLEKNRQTLVAVSVATLIALATSLALLPMEQALQTTTANTPLASLPGLPGDAPVLTTQPELPPADARALNAAIPFYAGRIAPAVPFRFTGSSADLARSRECLALAAMAEAGPSDIGQRAVIQVILNRVRHPAFAKTVCGVVFEGSERMTGCQFSFTCDGSLARRYSPDAWAAARSRAEGALYGRVFAGVGNATHYHTDWVHPYWSPRLVKLARVETHLFFRWPGFWGTPGAMRAPYRGGEPDPLALQASGDPASAEPIPTFAPLPPDTPKVSGGEVKVRDTTGRGNFLLIANHDAAQAAANARKLCGASATCRVLGWTDPAAIPATFPIPPAARAALQFSYSRDPAGTEIVLYGCDWFRIAAKDQCIPKSRR